MANRALPQLRVASPCPSNWDAMDGDDRVRFCHACRKNVYDLTAMGDVEIAALIERTEGRFCGRLYRRADERVLTADCPVGLSMLKHRAMRFRARLAAMLLLGFGGFGYGAVRSHASDDAPLSAVTRSRVVATLKRWACVDPRQFVLGDVGPRTPLKTTP